MSKLYLVSTPIGNLEDISLRAINILSQVDIIACEDTRKTGLLLKRIKVKNRPKLISFYEENEIQRIPQLVQLIKQGNEVALVSNSGTPTIADPGFKLVRECLRQKIEVIPIPGASAVLAGLVASGLATDKFLFLGFLPKKEGKKEKILNESKKIPWPITLIVYESPYRLIKTLELFKKIFGNQEIVICRELTKLHQEIRREKISESLDHFQEKKPKGEITLLIRINQSKTKKLEFF